MKKVILVLLTLVTFSLQAQTTFTYDGVGDWDDENLWSPSYPGTTINDLDEVIITAASEVIIRFITINGTVTNEGYIHHKSSFKVNGLFINNGEVKSSSSIDVGGEAINNGTWQSNSFFDLRDGGSFINKDQFSSLSFFKIHSGGILTNEGVLTNTSVVFENFGSLINNGIHNIVAGIKGSNVSHTSDVELNKSIRPNTTNSDIGTYTFNNSFTLGDNGAFYVDIETNSSADALIIGETATLKGVLIVTLLEDENQIVFDPEVGTQYTIITAETITGTFSAFRLPELMGKEFNIVYNPTSVVLEVIEPLGFSNNELNAKVDFYPNPTKDVVHVNGLTQEKKAILYSSNGIQLKTIDLSPANSQIDLSALFSGFYYILIGDTNYPIIKE